VLVLGLSASSRLRLLGATLGARVRDGLRGRPSASSKAGRAGMRRLG